MDSTVHPHLLFLGLNAFFPCTPFSNPCRSQLPFAKRQLLRDYFGCPTKSCCGAVQEFSLPISSFPWALLVSQLLLWLSLPFKEMLLSPEHPPSALASWLQAAVVHICIACRFWLLLPVLSRSGDRPTMNDDCIPCKNMKNLS